MVRQLKEDRREFYYCTEHKDFAKPVEHQEIPMWVRESVKQHFKVVVNDGGFLATDIHSKRFIRAIGNRLIVAIANTDPYGQLISFESVFDKPITKDEIETFMAQMRLLSMVDDL